MVGNKTKIEVFSFGKKYINNPSFLYSEDSINYIFDCRFLDNPFYFDSLRELTGLDEPVKEFFRKNPLVDEFVNNCLILIEQVIKSLNNKKKKVVVYFCCTGGQHRSVYCAESFFKKLTSGLSGNNEASIKHLNIDSSYSELVTMNDIKHIILQHNNRILN